MRAATGAPHGGAARRAARAGAWLAAACLAAAAARPAALAAQQVGNPPERSPYRDIIEHQSITLFGGQFGGNPGRAGVGAMAAWAFGGQLAVRLSGPMDLWVTLGEAASRRHSIIADTNVTKTDSARPGPDVNLPLVLADIGLGLNVTGDKTWHGLAPYVGASLGIVAPTQKVTDPGGFTVGTNFSLVPAVGTRYFLGRTLALRLEVRDYLFRYQYPLAYFDSLTLHYTGPPPRSAVLPLGTTDRQWVHNLTLWLGVSYLFTF